MNSLCYIAMPYSHKDEAVIQQRMEKFYKISADLLNEGKLPISPVLNHPICERHKIPGSYTFWKEYSQTLLSKCDELIVLRMPGWEESIGVLDEIRFAIQLNIPIKYMDV